MKKNKKKKTRTKINNPENPENTVKKWILRLASAVFNIRWIFMMNEKSFLSSSINLMKKALIKEAHRFEGKKYNAANTEVAPNPHILYVTATYARKLRNARILAKKKMTNKINKDISSGKIKSISGTAVANHFAGCISNLSISLIATTLQKRRSLSIGIAPKESVVLKGKPRIVRAFLPL